MHVHTTFRQTARPDTTLDFFFHKVVYPRGPVDGKNWNTIIRKVYEQLDKDCSTADVLHEWFAHSCNPQSSNYLSSNPLHMLHQVVHCDHLDLLRVIN